MIHKEENILIINYFVLFNKFYNHIENNQYYETT